MGLKMKSRVGRIRILHNTLKVTAAGKYTKNGKDICLKKDGTDYREAIVWNVEAVRQLKEKQLLQRPVHDIDKAPVFTVTNRDSFEAAAEIMKSDFWNSETPAGKVLVLNFANSVHPGGGVRYGDIAQEEDLCRRSTLLVSLESDKAREYYKFNRKLSRRLMSSDSMIISPDVAVFRQRNGQYMDEPISVSVLTCAAPALGHLGSKLCEKQLEDILYQRILAMLYVAAEQGYEYLVLGAWGCGAFGNDAGQVAKQFARAFEDFRVNITADDGKNLMAKAGSCFRYVEFAVLDSSKKKYNFNCFLKQFPGVE